MRKSIAKLIIALLVIITSVIVVLVGMNISVFDYDIQYPNALDEDWGIRQGLDLVGGSVITYEADVYKRQPLHNAGVMPAMGAISGLFHFFDIYSFLRLADRRRRLNGSCNHNRHTVCNAAVYTAVMIGFCFYFTVLNIKRIVRLAAAHL